jgi:predicted methyltransferase
MAGVRLIQGDCLEVMPTLAGGSIDLILADPPLASRLVHCTMVQ